MSPFCPILPWAGPWSLQNQVGQVRIFTSHFQVTFKFWGADSVCSGGEDWVGSSSWNYPQNVPVPVRSSVMDPTGPSSATYRPEWLSCSGKFCVILSGPICLNIPHARSTLHPVTWDATAPFLPGPHPPLWGHRNSYFCGAGGKGWGAVLSPQVVLQFS